MKTTTYSLLFGFALLLGAGSIKAATPDGADAYLVSPWDYEGHNIRLNVVSVRPANFESPIPGIMFYHANTETLEHKPGGEMLICVPKDESEHFARFYGMDPRNRNVRILSGTFRLAHHHHPHRDHPGDQNDNDAAPVTSGSNSAGEHADRHEGGVWFVDYKGDDKDILDKNPDLELPAGGGPGDHHDGPGGNVGPAPGPNGPAPRGPGRQ